MAPKRLISEVHRREKIQKREGDCVNDDGFLWKAVEMVKDVTISTYKPSRDPARPEAFARARREMDLRTFQQIPPALSYHTITTKEPKKEQKEEPCDKMKFRTSLDYSEQQCKDLCEVLGETIKNRNFFEFDHSVYNNSGRVGHVTFKWE